MYDSNGHPKIINSAQKPKPVKKTQTTTKSVLKFNSFIIQKYIEQPLLIYKRKFDIRIWVFVNYNHDCYFFKEGYLRTTSTEFNIDMDNIDNKFVHLTNNAIQKYSKSYGQFEDGNQLSFKQFQEYINQNYPPDQKVSVKNELVPKMKTIIVKSLLSIRKKLDPHNRKFCFELYGYDFIIDSEFNPWLIEVNTNPCLEESSKLLKAYLPRMIDDMLKISIDTIFPRPKRKVAIQNGTQSRASPKKETKKVEKITNQNSSITDEAYSSINANNNGRYNHDDTSSTKEASQVKEETI